MTAYLLALSSAALYGAADFMGGVAARRASTAGVVCLSQAAGMALLAVLLPLLPDADPSPADLAWGMAAGVSGGTGVALLYRALATGRMAVVAPTTALCAVALPVLVAALLGERLAPRSLGGIALAFVAIFLVSRQKEDDTAKSTRTSGLPPGLGLALWSGVAIGIFFLTLARTGQQAGLWPLLAARGASMLLFGIAVAGGAGSFRMSRRTLAIAAVGGTVDMLANALYLVASRAGTFSIVVTLASLYPASTVLLARVVLGERLTWWQQCGVLCALVAVVLMVAS